MPAGFVTKPATAARKETAGKQCNPDFSGTNILRCYACRRPWFVSQPASQTELTGWVWSSFHHRLAQSFSSVPTFARWTNQRLTHDPCAPLQQTLFQPHLFDFISSSSSSSFHPIFFVFIFIFIFTIFCRLDYSLSAASSVQVLASRRWSSRTPRRRSELPVTASLTSLDLPRLPRSSGCGVFHIIYIGFQVFFLDSEPFCP
ncbi:hypothetical protein TRV_00360 [Trichophyton verrucosum HKI 0517]|uniref:Transmembrane protein n=1 Tax=Trichophyton verrucosum (strain HKI 0517) TaxID=663202 RepID=D4CZW6_TRIVH|nr:uncharacterized protein TRV_00360 [Trichophyton verrucosum HKI 0517]EFE44879.1 hypothetical protein TRV_00360 [Trichophyton verrucosum HKI 0517]